MLTAPRHALIPQPRAQLLSNPFFKELPLPWVAVSWLPVRSLCERNIIIFDEWPTEEKNSFSKEETSNHNSLQII